MVVAIKIPDMGTTVDTVILTTWLVKEGEHISRGDPIAEIQTDKANVQLESVAEGILLKCIVEENTELSVGQILAYIGSAGEIIDDAAIPDSSCNPVKNEQFTTSPESSSIISVHENPTGEAAGDSGKSNDGKKRVKGSTPVSMMVRNLARKHQLDLNQVRGTGKGGSITREDVMRLVNSTSPVTPIPDENDPSFLLDLYRKMLLIRRFEERVKYLFLEGIMPGTIHQYQGEEAVAVGVCATLNRDDIITSTHRPHGHAIAKGIPINSLLNELFGKTTGCCRGKGGSMHVGDLELGMVPAIAIVGGNVPLATGCALAFKMRGESRVAVSFMGDGAINEGAFHEGVNMGAIWSLPVIYVIENNLYSASTPIGSTVKLSKLSDRALGYGIPGVTIDGNDVMEVYRASREAVDRARKGKGPTLIEAITYRITGHSRRDPCNYQPEEERNEAIKKEPIGRFEKHLIETGLINRDQLNQISKEIDLEIEEAVQEAINGPDPKPEDALQDVFV